MVSVKIVSRYAENFPERVDGFRRKIAEGPLYSAEEVKRILSAHGVAGVSAWTRECSSDLQKLEIDGMGLVELLRQALSSGRYLGSSGVSKGLTAPGRPVTPIDLTVGNGCLSRENI